MKKHWNHEEITAPEAVNVIILKGYEMMLRTNEAALRTFGHSVGWTWAKGPGTVVAARPEPFALWPSLWVQHYKGVFRIPPGNTRQLLFFWYYSIPFVLLFQTNQTEKILSASFSFSLVSYPPSPTNDLSESFSRQPTNTESLAKIRAVPG